MRYDKIISTIRMEKGDWKMRIAYCDDEKIQEVFLKNAISQWERTSNISCEITTYGSAEEMLFENPGSFPFDIIILDIELNHMNGIELARSIRRVDKHVMIAFLSNSREYVFQGYEVQAVRYFVKPLSEEQLFPVLDMVKQISDQKQYIIVGGAGEKIKLDFDEIIYVEALGHYINIYTEKSNYEIKMNMIDIAGKLTGCFISTHRSYLVNLRHIEKITKTECHLKGGHTIPVSRSAYKQVNQEFISFYKGGVHG
jgi:DNA-binding LytR/AlgR family response regulator